MAEHKFKIGQIVIFRPQKLGPVDAPRGEYKITRRLPGTDGELEYAIKSVYENHERVARESELTRA